MSVEPDLADRSDRAVAALFDRHARVVLRFAIALLRDADEAQDVVQDVFVVAWRRRRSIPLVDGSALPWLLTTTRLTAMASRRRSVRRRAVAVADDDLQAIPAPATGADEGADLRAALAALDPRDRAIVELVLVDGLTYAEAATRLGLTVSATGKRLQRARARLQRELRPEGTAP